MRTRWVAAAAACLLSALAYAPAAAADPVLSSELLAGGTVDDDERRTAKPALAQDPASGGSLLVWFQRAEDGFHVYARRLAVSGRPLGDAFRISAVATPENYTAGGPAVIHNSHSGEYLVAWASPRLGLMALHGQRVASDGRQVGEDDFAISHRDTPGLPRVFAPALAYNSLTGDYLAVWWGDNDQVYAQRLDQVGRQIGPDDVRVSRMEGYGVWPSVAYNRSANEYLVVWEGLDRPRGDGIFARRLDGRGVPLLDEDLLMSMPKEGRPQKPAVAAHPTGGDYSVTWTHTVDEFLPRHLYARALDPSGALGPELRVADDANGAAPVLAPGHVSGELTLLWGSAGAIVGRRSSSLEGLVGATTIQLSEPDPSGTRRLPADPAAVFLPAAGEYGLAWARRPGLFVRRLGEGSPPPDTALGEGPSGTTSSREADFTFSASDPSAGFECRLDFATWEPCSSPHRYEQLTDRGHVFEVHAISSAGWVDTTHPSRSWTVAAGPPETTFTEGPPPLTNERLARFRLQADEEATLECRLDDEPWRSCTSHETRDNLAAGEHRFEARATDGEGNVEPEPAVYRWTIDLTPPDTTIDSGPSGEVDSDEHTFSFSSADAGASFECVLSFGEPSTWQPCESPATFRSWRDHLNVRAVDRAGNPDPTPAVRSWSDSEAPELTMEGPPVGPNASPDATITFEASEPATFRCKLDGQAFEPCDSPVSLRMDDGSHYFEVTATDRAGNSHSAGVGWDVQAPGPNTSVGARDREPNSTSATFDFSADSPAHFFQCRTDKSAWTGCVSPTTVTGLGHGAHVFEVRAVDAFGTVDPVPASARVEVDREGPVIEFTDAPPATSDTSEARFDWNSRDSAYSDQPAVSDCRLDGGLWERCQRPKTYTGLADGAHRLEVRSYDKYGNVSARPGVHDWTVADTKLPNTTFVATPGKVSRDVVTFEFEADEPAGFRCRLDDGAWEQCISPRSYAGLGDGLHYLEVLAIDGAGNQEHAAANWTWTVDTAEPDTAIHSDMPDRSITARGFADFRFESNEALEGGYVECRLDGAAWVPCHSHETNDSLADGRHVLEARAKDGAGNVDPSPATHTWIVDRDRPAIAARNNFYNGESSNFRTGVHTPRFDFETAAEHVGFRCTLTRWSAGSRETVAGPSACSSPVTYELESGEYEFVVRSVTADGFAEHPGYRRRWHVAADPPETNIDGGPSGAVASSRAEFWLESSQDDATFECSLDDGPWQPCRRPVYEGLSEGEHALRGRAVSVNGVLDPTPDVRIWTVDLTPPETELTVTPPARTESRDAQFEFRGPEADLRFSCRLDDDFWQWCSSPRLYQGLAAGTHRFEVRAVDPAGNADSTPAAWTWEIHAPGPPAEEPPQEQPPPADPPSPPPPTSQAPPGSADAVRDPPPGTTPPPRDPGRVSFHSPSDLVGDVVRQLRRLSSRRLALRTKLRADFQAEGAGLASVYVWLTETRRGRRSRRVLVARGARRFRGADEKTITLRLTSRGRAALRRAGRARLTIEARFAPPGERTARSRRTIRLRR